MICTWSILHNSYINMFALHFNISAGFRVCRFCFSIDIDILNIYWMQNICEIISIYTCEISISIIIVYTMYLCILFAKLWIIQLHLYIYWINNTFSTCTCILSSSVRTFYTGRNKQTKKKKIKIKQCKTNRKKNQVIY